MPHQTTSTSSNKQKEFSFNQGFMDVLQLIIEFLNAHDHVNLSLVEKAAKNMVDTVDLKSQSSEVVTKALIRRIGQIHLFPPSNRLMSRISYLVAHNEHKIQKLARFLKLQNDLRTNTITATMLENDLHQLVNISHDDKLLILAVMLWVADSINVKPLAASFLEKLIREILGYQTTSLFPTSIFSMPSFISTSQSQVMMHSQPKVPITSRVYYDPANPLNANETIKLLAPVNKAYFINPVRRQVDNILNPEIFYSFSIQEKTGYLLSITSAIKKLDRIDGEGKITKWLRLIPLVEEKQHSDLWFSKLYEFISQEMFTGTNYFPVALAELDTALARSKSFARQAELRSHLKNTPHLKNLWWNFLLNLPLTATDISELSLISETFKSFSSVLAEQPPQTLAGVITHPSGTPMMSLLQMPIISSPRPVFNAHPILPGMLLRKIHKITPLSAENSLTILKSLFRYIELQTIFLGNKKNIIDIFECFYDALQKHDKKNVHTLLYKSFNYAKSDSELYFQLGRIFAKCAPDMLPSEIMHFIEIWSSPYGKKQQVVTIVGHDNLADIVSVSDARDFIMRPLFNYLTQDQSKELIEKLKFNLAISQSSQDIIESYRLIYTLACLEFALSPEDKELCIKAGLDYFTSDIVHKLWSISILSSLSHCLTPEIGLSLLPGLIEWYQEDNFGQISRRISPPLNSMRYEAKNLVKYILQTLTKHASHEDILSCIDKLVEMGDAHIKIVTHLMKFLNSEQINRKYDQFACFKTQFFMTACVSHLSNERNALHSASLQKKLFNENLTAPLISAFKALKMPTDKTATIDYMDTSAETTTSQRFFSNSSSSSSSLKHKQEFDRDPREEDKRHQP